jgi:dihydrofolate reductase
MTTIAFVVAVAENGVIGRAGRLPWRLPTDLKRFRKLTLGKPVIMGRKTYQSIGKPLEGRDNIVVTRKRDFQASGAHVVPGVAEALELARSQAAARGVGEIMVIGGAEIFRQMLPLAGRVYLTLVHGRPKGDVVLDAFDPAVWRETVRERMQPGAGDQYSADFLVLDRQR